MQPISQPTSESIPALEVSLTGRHMIEASAGTGKTWTLTGILLRLLIEAKRSADHVIVTTFTRAAAAELREKVSTRLVDFRQVLTWLQHELAKHNADATQFLQTDKHAWLKEHISGATPPQQALLEDPINAHLVLFILNNIQDYSISDAIRRTQSILVSLDRLFIGTLDSLAQKWLTEYPAQTGQGVNVSISEDTDAYIDAIIHDELRAFHSHLYRNHNRAYEWLEQQDQLGTVTMYRSAANKALNFMTLPIDAVAVTSFDFASLDAALQQFAQCDISALQPLFEDKQARSDIGLNNRSSLASKLKTIVLVQDAIDQHGTSFKNHLSADATKFCAAVAKLIPPWEQQKPVGFVKNWEKHYASFVARPPIAALMEVEKQLNHLSEFIDTLQASFVRQVMLSVRQKLADRLAANDQTTFSLQMQRINAALTGEQGQTLAQHIRHQYPIALIDESQDMNGAQAQMIEHIYMQKPSNNGFLLLVGDPKQAIYGFRGGDVTNHTLMRQKFGNNRSSLNINRRSHRTLIDAINAWFGMTIDDRNEKNSLSNLGNEISYQRARSDKKSLMKVTNNQKSIKNLKADTKAAVAVINVPYKLDKDIRPGLCDLKSSKNWIVDNFDDCDATARHIDILLRSNMQLDGRPIAANDIAVLGRRKKELNTTAKVLARLGIATSMVADISIFSTRMASDLLALLQAILARQHDRVHRVLTSSFYGVDVHTLKHILDKTPDLEAASQAHHVTDDDFSQKAFNDIDYQAFFVVLQQAHENWKNFGVLSALSYLFDFSDLHHNDHTGFFNDSVWQRLAKLSDGERYLMDLRQLLNILANKASRLGEHEVIDWLEHQIRLQPITDWSRQTVLPSESGVQLMTIHKSKGLQFPIVYVVGMEGGVGGNERTSYPAYLYDAPIQDMADFVAADLPPRRLSVTPATQCYDLPIDAAQQALNDEYDERKRLGYVAFTRAIERLYIVIQNPYNTKGMDYKVMNHWLHYAPKDTDTHRKGYHLPQRLKGLVDWIDGVTVLQQHLANIETPNETPSKASSKFGIDQPVISPIEFIDFNSVITTCTFKGWSKTSFTALTRSSTSKQQNVSPSADDDHLDTAALETKASNMVPIYLQSDVSCPYQKAYDRTNIRFRFVKGANAGSFLHEVLELIDMSDKKHWSVVIDSLVKKYGLSNIYLSQSASRLATDATDDGMIEESKTETDKHQEIKDWLADVITKPLMASSVALKDIKKKHKQAELTFNMGLNDFDIEAINQAFRTHLASEPNKQIQINNQTGLHILKYLQGEIDLVYQHEGKFYVVDYKSNHLGDDIENYTKDRLNKAMNKAGYWLQAVIYQVALHRFLKLKIANYLGQEEKFLGAVEYVFLRGITANQHAGTEPTDHQRGLIHWDIPIDLIKALDAIFG